MQHSTELRPVRRWLDALNRCDWKVFVELMTPNAMFTFTHRLPDERATLHGREAILNSYTGWKSGFSELTGEITDGFSSGNRVAIQLWWTGTTAAGNSIGFAACFLITTAGNQITEIVDFYDQFTYNAQIDK